MKAIEIVGVIIVILVIAVAIILLLQKYGLIPGSDNLDLNQMCLKLIKNGCDESSLGESFVDACNKNGMDVENCKSYCGCQ